MHRIRLYPTATQVDCLEFMLHVSRDVHNACLQERRDAYRMRGISLSTAEQYAELTALRQEDPRLQAVYREVLDAVLHRLHLAFTAFFRRLARGERPGYPRFKGASRWRQLEFPHGNRALKLNADQTEIRVPGVGSIRLRKGREVPAFGRAFIVVKNGHWYAVFESSREPEPLPPTGKVVGVDCGVHVLAATSEGRLLGGRKSAERNRRVVARLAREVEAVSERDAAGRCRNRRDPKRVAAVRRLARAKERQANVRLDHLHKTALELVREHDVLGMEKLDVRSMTRSAKGTLEHPGRNVRAKSGLNRALLDAGFGTLRRLIGEKAAYAARRVIDVDAKFSSQTCGRCQHVAAGSRWRRRFCCVACGFRLHADVNAALEIRRRAQLALTSVLSSGRPRLTPQDAG